MQKNEILTSILLNKYMITVFVLVMLLALTTIPGMPTLSNDPLPGPL